MKGVVLCGGKSIRMGLDKGLIEFESVTWANIGICKMLDVSLGVVLSVNKDQYKQYSERFENVVIAQDNASLHVYGPLKGIFSVHLQYPEEDLLVLACDMP